MDSANAPKRSCVTLLTDFGTSDTYVGQMKGSMIGIDSNIQIIDLTHAIPPQQILRAAYIWNDAVAAFPNDTIHVAVVDPGVGGTRRLIAAEIGERKFVCPDNGLLTVIMQQAELKNAVSLDKPTWWRRSISNTFHGRDILAPVAAAWSLGRDLSELGTPLITPLIELPGVNVTRSSNSLIGRVVNIDRFGNLITNVVQHQIPNGSVRFRVEIGAVRIEGISRCYADVPEGEPIALIGSSGRLEVSIRNGNAAEELQIDCGRNVVVRWEGLQG